MSTGFHQGHSGYRDAANDSSSGDMPPDESLVPVLASRASVLAAATAMGHKPGGDENGTKSGRANGTEEQTTAGDKKKGRDQTYRRAEREEDAKAGIKPCPVKLPVALHQSLRQRVHDILAPEGSRALLAFAAFTLRPELSPILHAIELRSDRDDFLKALQCIVQHDWLVKTAIRLSTVAPKPPTALHAQIPRLVDAMVRSPELISAIMTVTTSPTVQKLCGELSDKEPMQEQLLHLVKRPDDMEFLMRMTRLSQADREFLLKLLNLDRESKRGLVAAARHPTIINFVWSAGRDKNIHDAIQTVVQNPTVARTGLAVINGKGLLGWIARKATHVLLRRQQSNPR
jgi:hypothetical protein